jgi:hypothetical protein
MNFLLKSRGELKNEEVTLDGIFSIHSVCWLRQLGTSVSGQVGSHRWAKECLGTVVIRLKDAGLGALHSRPLPNSDGFL